MASKPFVTVALLQQSIPIVDREGRPSTAFVRLINDNNANVSEAINRIAQLPEIQAALERLDEATAAAQAAAEAAQAAADTASSSTAAQQRETSLQSSYISPSSVLTASPTTITVETHQRFYPQPMGSPISVQVAGATFGATTPGTIAYVFYVDPERDGGTVTYQASLDPPTQTGDTHVVGAVEIPAEGVSEGGDGPSRPGAVRPRENQQIE